MLCVYIYPPPETISCVKKVNIFVLLFHLLLFVASGEEGVKRPPQIIRKKDFTSNFFVYSGLQTFMAVAQLKDYTQPKPGWRLGTGYTFFHQKKHSLPLYFEMGHSVVAGINPLVRTFDVFPLMMNVGYEWQAHKYFTLGASVGFGMFVSNIKHYPTSLDLLQNKIKSTNGLDSAFTSAISFGTNLLENNLELRASFSLDVIIEKPKVIPLPSFQIGMRCYPKGLYYYSKRKDRVETEDLTQYETIYVYFLPESAELDINAISQIRKAGDRLKEHSELYILFEGSTAQFGSVMGREQLEAERVGAVTEYLQKQCGIDKARILYTPKIKEEKGNKKGKVEHTQYRWVRMRFIRIYFNFNSGEKNVYAD